MHLLLTLLVVSNEPHQGAHVEAISFVGAVCSDLRFLSERLLVHGVCLVSFHYDGL